MNSVPHGSRGAATKKRSVIIDGHKTSLSLEDDFWHAVAEIAHAREITLSDLISAVDEGRTNGNLSSALRLFVLAEVRAGRLGPKPNEPPRRRFRRRSANPVRIDH